MAWDRRRNLPLVGQQGHYTTARPGDKGRERNGEAMLPLSKHCGSKSRFEKFIGWMKISEQITRYARV